MNKTRFPSARLASGCFFLGLSVVLLLVAMTARAQGVVPNQPPPSPVLSGSKLNADAGSRGMKWCDAASGASAAALASLSVEMQRDVAKAEQDQQSYQDDVDLCEREVSRAEKAILQLAFDAARRAASLGVRTDNPAMAVAQRSFDEADIAYVQRRGLLAKANRLREERDQFVAHPDPASNRTLEMIKRDVAQADRAVIADEQATGESLQQLFAARESARSNVAAERVRQGLDADLLAADAAKNAATEYSKMVLRLEDAKVALSYWKAEANVVRAWRDAAIPCIAKRQAQLALLDKPAPSEPANPGGANWAGQVSSSWSASCGETSDGGRFSLTVDAQGNFTVTFVEGAAASIAGSVDSAGKLSGGGNYEMGGRQYRIRIWGTVSRSPSGGLSGTGNFASGDGRVVCNGSWGKSP